MVNYNRMTIKEQGGNCLVFKVKQQFYGWATDMAGQRRSWIISGAAKQKFSGTHEECMRFIDECGAEFQQV